MTATTSGETFTLRANDPKAQQALETGWHESTRAIARRLISSSEADPDPEVLFERINNVSKRPPGIATWMQTFRAFSLTATATPCLAVGLLAIQYETEMNSILAITSLLGVICLQIAINVFNDVSDYLRLIDLPGTLGGSGVIQNGWWTPKALARIAWTGLALGVLLGLPSVLSRPSSLLGISAMGTLGTLLYSAKRLGLKYIALGDIAVFILCGPALTYGYSVAITGQPAVGVFWLGTFFGLLAMGILHANNLQDIKLDRQRGVVTIANILGFQRSLQFLTLLYVAAGTTLVVGVTLDKLPALSALGLMPLLAIALPWLRQVGRALGPESALLAQCRIKAAQIHLAAGVSVIIGLSVAIALGKFGR